MFSLRTISLFAAVACATLSSAVPLEPGSLALDQIVPRADGLDAVGGILGNSNPGGLLGGLKLPGSKRYGGPKEMKGQIYEISGSKRSQFPDEGKEPSSVATTQGPFRRADATDSIPQIFSDATTKVQPIVAKLQAAIKVTAGAKVEIAVVVGLLNEIVVILRGAIAQVNVLVKASLSVTVLLGSKTIAEVAIIIYGLLWIILQVLYAVVLVVGVAEVAVWAVVVIIGNLLVELLTITFGLVVGLQAAVIVLIQPAVITFITTLKFTALVTLLGIKA